MTSEQAVTVDLADHVATVEIHRPPHNWFDITVMTELADAVLGLDDEPECRAVVLCSEGKNFCAGADLEAAATSLDNTATLYEQAARLFSEPQADRRRGAGRGGGRRARPRARGRLPRRLARDPVQLQLRQARASTRASASRSTLPAVVGQQRALELMYTAVDVRGEEALRIGLADRLAAADELRDAALAFACGDRGVGAARVARDPRDHARRASPTRCAPRPRASTRSSSDLRETADFQEGVAATAERRPPNFTGR